MALAVFLLFRCIAQGHGKTRISRGYQVTSRTAPRMAKPAFIEPAQPTQLKAEIHNG
jgi:hypothetical protein